MIDIRQIVEDRINKLWTKFCDEEFCRYSPISVSKIPDNGLVFIGINPSLSDKTKSEIADNDNLKCEFYDLSDNRDENHRYFKKFSDIAEKTSLEWGHLDLLYNRETDQKKKSQEY